MKMTGAQIIVRCLLEQGVDTVFGYPGGTVLHIYDELYKHQDQITHYLTCHEQGAAHAADAYARVTGKVGVVMATSGPGATNLVTGIAAAFLDSTPLVAITGNVATALLGRDSFQEVDIAGVTMPVTKHNYIVRDIDTLADIIREGFDVARSGRPGPVLIDVPKDVQTGQAEYTPAAPGAGKKVAVCPEQITQAVKMIREAERPYIYCGGGAVLADASAQLQEFAQRLDAPVGASMMGLSAMPSDHPRFLGMVGMHGRYAATKALYESDLLISVGARFSDRATGRQSEFSQGRRVLQIDIDPAEINKNIPTDHCVIGDVKAALAQLCRELPQMERGAWQDQVRRMRQDPANDISMDPARLTPEYAVQGACAHMDGQGVVATDVGQHQMWVTQYYSFTQPRTFITSGGLGAMGFGMGAAIGACIASDRKRTLLFVGDGGFHMNMNELATAVTHNLPVVVVLLNNGVLGMVRQWQTLFFQCRYSNTNLERHTDYVKLAEALGARGYRAATREEYDAALAAAFSGQGPALVECVIDSDEKALPMIPPGEGIGEIIFR